MKNQRTRTFVGLVLSALLFAFPGAWARGAEKPNIVLIFIDDMGYGDIGPFGSTKNRTPHLDRMAAAGMKLTSFYAAPVCSVSRAQVMTGCYGQRVSIPGVFFPGGHYGISKDEHTVAELVKAQGYATMCIGKWHLGDQPEFLPTRHGFDHYFGLPYSNDMIKKAKVNGQLVVPLVRDEKVIELLTGEGQDHLTERYTDEAVKFITANKDHPFFLYLPHTAVHTPIHPGEKFRDKSKNGRFGDWVEEVDWSVGRVIDTLHDLKLAENTLVIFSSDNGPWLVKGTDGGEAGPLRGGKGSTWEGGVREPTLAMWPGKIAPGSVCDAVAGNIDFLPTFVKLAGGAVPADRKIDGKDISPLLLGRSKESPHEARYYYSTYKLDAVRVGSWKLAIAPQPERTSKATPPVFASLDKPRLYNLDTDIGERTDVAADHPDIVDRLKALAVKMAAELGDGKPGPAVRKAGYVENPVTLYPFAQDEKNAPPAIKKEAGAEGKGFDLKDLKVGEELAGENAPQVVGQPLIISCELITKSHDGVIVAHGGVMVGYALYLNAGHAVFAVHQADRDTLRIASPETLAEKTAIEARLAEDGTMTLFLDGKTVASGKSDGLLTRQPQEAFCVGHDSGKTVDTYDGKKLFEGTIINLRVSSAVPPLPPAAEPLAEWPQHLGPNRNGISPEKGLLNQWPAGGVKDVWRVKGGIGMSGLAISRGKLVTLVQRDGKQWLIALDADTGAARWETELATAYRNPMGDGPRATPTISGDRVFSFTGEGILTAVNLADGKKLWSHRVPDELKGAPAEYGMACSPLVASGQVIVATGSAEGTVAAFDAASGALAWTSGTDPVGYSSPVLLNVGGREQIVVATGNSVLGLAPIKGTVLWRFPFVTNYGCNTATPVAYKGQVFVSAGENHGSVLLSIKGEGEKLEVTKVWESIGPKSVLRSEWQTPILLDDHFYGFDNVGGAGPTSHLTCINAATGVPAWQQVRFGKGNLIFADGKLFIITFDGELVIAKASQKGYEELGRGALVGKTRQAPALLGGKLYVRDDQAIVCVDVRQPSAAH